MGWAAVVVMAGIVALLAAGLCFVTLRRMERRFALLEMALRDQVQTLDDAVRMMEARLAEARPAAGGRGAMAEREGDAAANGESVEAEIVPEIQAAIAAAAVVAAGSSARVRSVRRLNPGEDSSAWSQQGRVLVQSSHNLNPAGRP
ncbi:MAG TPA: hypothetical protein VGJ21_10470 [Terracidiphilus sp.]